VRERVPEMRAWPGSMNVSGCRDGERGFGELVAIMIRRRPRGWKTFICSSAESGIEGQDFGEARPVLAESSAASRMSRSPGLEDEECRRGLRGRVHPRRRGGRRRFSRSSWSGSSR